MTCPRQGPGPHRPVLRALLLLAAVCVAAGTGALVVVSASPDPAPPVLPYDPLPRW